MSLTKNVSEKRILVVGELLVDIISDNNITSLACPTQFSANQGGSSANLCANLSWLGVKSELVATVGNDNLGTFLINELKSAGVDYKHINRSANRQTSIVLVGKNEQTPDFIPYRNADLAIKRIDNSLLEPAIIIHTTAFALSKEPARSNILDALTKAAQMGKSISVDWNFAPSIWQDEDGKDVFKKIIQLNPMLKISIDDLERFTGETLTIEQSIAWLDSLNTQIICLTCGKNGVWFKEKNDSWKHKSAIPVSLIASVTGAGDAFWAGFLAAFINEKSAEESINEALKTAKLKIEKVSALYKP
ncbi:PfkB family carbohydrate kinase [Pedobacter aquatilis]|uniref:carbohydrate kinase family protein n=1 Tax=Pedobacter aquatilis TaxID=351343 RepID=UPI0025B54B3E|nr:PfkB family carbohydrate kinase [Pedobacter aquatilis]MDN3587505.1 PfkB family carbohydrate kinase [Pedobacter aquatilis]